MRVIYILTSLSPALFSGVATAHVRINSEDEAHALITSDKRMVGFGLVTNNWQGQLPRSFHGEAAVCHAAAGL